LSDEAVIKARGRREFYPDDEKTEKDNPGVETLTDIPERRERVGGTYSDIPNKNGGGTYSDIPGQNGKSAGTYSDIPGKKDEDGTIRDINPPKEPKKKKSKKLLFAGIAGLGVACIAAIALIFLLQPKDVEIEKIEGLPEEVVQMVVGDTLDLNPEVIPANATSEITFRSENENIATVDENGVITAVEVGEVTISVRGDDDISFVYLNISDEKIPVTDIIGLASTAELTVGSSLPVNAKVVPNDATEQITYSSSDTNVATIGPDGNITAVSAGQAIITASADGVVKEMVLTVKNKAKTPSGGAPKPTPKPAPAPTAAPAPVPETPSDGNTGGSNNESGGGNSSSKWERIDPETGIYD